MDADLSECESQAKAEFLQISWLIAQPRNNNVLTIAQLGVDKSKTL